VIFIGLLTHQQKQAGYFVAQDEDFIYIFHRADGKPRIVATFIYETARVSEIRDSATEDAKRRRIAVPDTPNISIAEVL